jgi:hypothetical protein
MDEFDSGYNDNYVYTPEDLDTSNQYTPSQTIDDFLGGQGNYQIDGTYFGQDQDWGNLNWGMTNQQNQYGGMPEFSLPQVTNFAPQQTQQSGAQDYLARLFSNPSFLTKGIAALFEGNQNKKMGSSMNKIAQNPALDPFGSQRPFYQQELQRAVTNPYDSPIVRAQVDNLQRMQSIKDAAAGRRSNSLSTAPGVLAAQADIAQKYMNSLQTPAGANIAPQGKAIADLLSQGAQYNTNGAISPLIRAIQSGVKGQELMDLFNNYRG